MIYQLSWSLMLIVNLVDMDLMQVCVGYNLSMNLLFFNQIASTFARKFANNSIKKGVKETIVLPSIQQAQLN
mgnify:FL=1